MTWTKKKKNDLPFGGFLREPSLFDDDESTFLDTRARRKVYVHLVPAPWSRVLLLSLIYALAVNFAKLAWFEVIGRPEWGPPLEKPKEITAALPGHSSK